jgi:hypothetical protein
MSREELGIYRQIDAAGREYPPGSAGKDAREKANRPRRNCEGPAPGEPFTMPESLLGIPIVVEGGDAPKSTPVPTAYGDY